MQTSALRNAIVHAVHAYETRRERYPQGRRRKLSIGYMLDRIFYICRTGCQWSQLHVQSSSYKTVFHYFNLWSKARIFEDVFYDTVRERVLTRGAVAVDTSFVKNVYGRDVTGRNPTDRGRKATKVSLLTDCRGTPLCSVFHRGNKSDALSLKHLLDTAARKTRRLCHYDSLMADKGYDSATCRATCATHNLLPLIPKRGTRDIMYALVARACLSKFKR